jgi:hypothetical protein
MHPLVSTARRFGEPQSRGSGAGRDLIFVHHLIPENVRRNSAHLLWRDVKHRWQIRIGEPGRALLAEAYPDRTILSLQAEDAYAACNGRAAQAAVQAVGYFAIKTDGLQPEWYGRVWLSPPYAQPHIEQFVNKLIFEYCAKRTEAAY